MLLEKKVSNSRKQGQVYEGQFGNPKRMARKRNPDMRPDKRTIKHSQNDSLKDCPNNIARENG